MGTDLPRSRMSELPPPERKPEPMGFTPRAKPSPPGSTDQPPQPRPAAGTPGKSVSTSTMQRQLVGVTIGERYRVKGILGEGGMGMVYDAEHLGLGRAVAIKVLAPSQAKKKVAVKRFQQEARAAGAIGHPNICEVYDMGLLDDGSPYLVMEKLVGSTLAERITREGGLPFDEISDVMIQVLSGLIAAHEKGIVHRDIKPENIFLARRAAAPPVAKILDFGVSKMLPTFLGDAEQLDLTRTGMVMGTPYYMSPEQARGERNLDGRVDVYACGVMLYEMIVGRRPYLAANYNALLLAIINTSPRRIVEIRPATPPPLEMIVANAMAKVREQRYPTAHNMLREIQVLRLSKPRVPVARPVVPEAAKTARRTSEPPARDDGPAAALRRRMAEARPPPSIDPRAEHTRVEIPPRVAAPWSRLVPPPESESVDIPIDVMIDELADLDGDDEMPTEILRPGQAFAPRSTAPATAPLPPPAPAIPKHWQELAKKPVNPDETLRMDADAVDFDETRIAPPKRRR